MKGSAIIRQSLPILTICGLGGLLTGSVFGSMVDLLLDEPGLVVLIPALISMRGNIASSMGSRLGTSVHLGLLDVDDLWGPEVRKNFKASMLLSLFMSLLIGLFAFATVAAFGIGGEPNGVLLISVSVLSGLITGIIFVFITIGIILVAFKRGYDPDNVTGPALATIGDFITIFCIFGLTALLAGVV